jgi:GINS complex subunit 3
MLSKVQIPIWLAYTIIYSSVSSPSLLQGANRQKAYRDWAEFNIPTPFGPRVRNALKAEACSVRLSNLVGQGGLWYGFGKTIMDMYVTCNTVKHLAC